MSENSCIFFTLLEQAYKLEAEKRLRDITVISIPHVSEESARQIQDSYKRGADDILDEYDTDNVSTKKEIRQALQ